MTRLDDWKEGAFGFTRCSWIGHCLSSDLIRSLVCSRICFRCSASFRGAVFLIWKTVASSSYGVTSFSSIVSAPVGQEPRHAPRPSQYNYFTSRAFPSIIWTACSGQAWMQSPQPVHFFSSILIIFLSIVYFSLPTTTPHLTRSQKRD